MQFIFYSGSLREKYFRSQLTQEMNTFEHRQGQKHFKQIQFVKKNSYLLPLFKKHRHETKSDWVKRLELWISLMGKCFITFREPWTPESFP